MTQYPTEEMIEAGLAAMVEAESTPCLNPPDRYLVQVILEAAMRAKEQSHSTPSPALPSEEMIDRIAAIIDPDAWYTGLPIYGCGKYWHDRRNRARTKARAIVAMQATPETGWQGIVGALRDARSVIARLVDESNYRDEVLAKIDAALSASDLGKAKPETGVLNDDEVARRFGPSARATPSGEQS